MSMPSFIPHTLPSPSRNIQPVAGAIKSMSSITTEERTPVRIALPPVRRVFPKLVWEGTPLERKKREKKKEKKEPKRKPHIIVVNPSRSNHYLYRADYRTCFQHQVIIPFNPLCPHWHHPSRLLRFVSSCREPDPVSKSPERVAEVAKLGERGGTNNSNMKTKQEEHTPIRRGGQERAGSRAW